MNKKGLKLDFQFDFAVCRELELYLLGQVYPKTGMPMRSEAMGSSTWEWKRHEHEGSEPAGRRLVIFMEGWAHVPIGDLCSLSIS